MGSRLHISHFYRKDKIKHQTPDIIMSAMQKSVAQQTFPSVQFHEGNLHFSLGAVSRCLPWPFEERDHLITLTLKFQ
jgi:hypothetical protein